ncbi:MAG TPA: 3-oxoacyl-ACP reductase family protein [Acidimicrobiia bacterium]|nr:3-oxoacyl-ACP reductase family protein [Acidimicrobiia bacterium]
MAEQLKGQVAIVTGGARNIGRRICEVLAERGATVVSFDLAASTETVASIEKAGGKASYRELDVIDEAAVESAVGEVLTEHGQIDILVNNAGLFAGIERRPFWEIDAAEWDKVVAVNTRSVFLMTRAVSRPMREAGRGRIVNIASNVVTFGMADLMHYVASKAAVVGMTRSMARELGSYGIAVNAVSPGLVTTELTAATIADEYRQQVVQGQCLKEPLIPDDIATAVAFLAGPEARLITGQTMLVNGGASMGPA